MSYFKVKTDVNDRLFSKIIRFGLFRCERCGKNKPLECAHVFSRRYKATRFCYKPARNAVALCFDCHKWFDSHKIISVIFEPRKRVFEANEESFTFLVSRLRFTWRNLQALYTTAQSTPKFPYSVMKSTITQELKKELKRLEAQFDSDNGLL